MGRKFIHVEITKYSNRYLAKMKKAALEAGYVNVSSWIRGLIFKAIKVTGGSWHQQRDKRKESPNGENDE